MPETLDLMRRLAESDAPELAATMVAALGEPPDTQTVAALPADDQIPRGWAHAYSWSAASLAAATELRAAAIALCRGRWGPPLADGLVVGPPVAFYRPSPSPFDLDELQARPAIDCARMIAAWTPNPGDDFGPSRHGLATTLKELIARDPAAWTADGCEQLVSSLAHPVYLIAYFQALAEWRQDTLPPTSLAAIEEAARLAHRRWLRSTEPVHRGETSGWRCCPPSTDSRSPTTAPAGGRGRL